jgi:hypothetical protein
VLISLAELETVVASLSSSEGLENRPLSHGPHRGGGIVVCSCCRLATMTSAAVAWLDGARLASVMRECLSLVG